MTYTTRDFNNDRNNLTKTDIDEIYNVLVSGLHSKNRELLHKRLNKHLKLIPQDIIVKFIEARYQYNRDVKPSEIILQERAKLKALQSTDLNVDTSNYILYQIKEFNKLMTNIYCRLKDVSPYPNMVQYHLNGKFGIQKCIEQYCRDALDPNLRVIKAYQSLETVWS